MTELTVVGIGPGSYEGMTVGAVRALENADIIVGYTSYCRKIHDLFPDKEYVSTPMRQEAERCRAALALAASGKRVAMICSGDAGIYGMASPILALAGEYGVKVRIVPGVTAALAGAAGLGSPLTADFCVLSLSDLLTPWEIIEKRLDLASSADLVLVLYNPGSRARTGYLARACGIVSRHRGPGTVCGVAVDVGGKSETFKIMTLSELFAFKAGMDATVFIGNSSTMLIDGRMVTPRGYKL